MKQDTHDGNDRLKTEQKIQQLQQAGDAKRSSSAAKYKGEMQQVLRLATAIAASVGVGGILSKGFMQDTVEADKLSKSMQLLGREIGQGFAPYVRAATTGILELVKWFRSLDQETKVQVSGWILLAGGIAATIALLPVVTAAITAVGAALALLLSPIGLIAGALVGLGVYFIGASSDSMSFSDIVGKVAEFIARVWLNLCAVFASGYSIVADTLDNVWQMLKSTVEMENPFANVHGYGEGLEKAWEGIDEKAKRFGANTKDWASSLTDRLATIKTQLNGIGNAMGKTFNETKDSGFHIKFDVALEGVQGTFDRLLKAFADPNAESIDEAQLGQLKQVNDNLQLNVAAIQDVRKALPMVR